MIFYDGAQWLWRWRFVHCVSLDVKVRLVSLATASSLMSAFVLAIACSVAALSFGHTPCNMHHPLLIEPPSAASSIPATFVTAPAAAMAH
ncbi:hypothetical protein ACLKA6_010588 [Drosophila palustris]